MYQTKSLLVSSFFNSILFIFYLTLLYLISKTICRLVVGQNVWWSIRQFVGYILTSAPIQ
ncbi:hypothetical protein barba108A_phanotate88 [Rheinheimera phage vB_RspM_barba_10-8A]|uniref:Uncharacterized protein n=30 Tax=Barbavirus barba18A TaxID=2734090 RepID=A0A7G9VRW6_9CAUD|nr:hypothetical protein barba13A_phanotate53 [Rheinheimera phage vB_RspM_barba_1-3A]QNO01599.1 hypothetical protein barba108A_phanotate88 [Rheinheimera phage vB_RspM_barba_10-8A]QNO01726.1 hypothetical protein barba108B_phanotate55 [Rheinheimera phage vB_RspM_barba_10-8B]QNO01920.1 hypothetical protein barba108D_phanotate89 [Rheinheimera phage vB_RspM_barba_10-8D]QNO03029.1 hypothetical protein barba109G_phanotate53 [Rheinheimera phage vB_RspM_barba_10-9G]QNO03213.1 hypothetical protein barba1